MMFKSKIKWVALGGLVLSILSLLVHMFLANSSAELVHYHVITGFVEDLNTNVVGKQPILPPKWAEYQRLRCRVAFHALDLRPDILALAHHMLKRLRASGNPYLAYHPGLVRDALAYQGCADLFQDVHTELVQYRRAQMIKKKLVHDELSVDSFVQKVNGLCPLMPEEVGLLLRAIGYPLTTESTWQVLKDLAVNV